MLIKKNFTIILIAMMLIAIIMTIYGMWTLLNSKADVTTLIQFLGILAALIVGMVTALSSWSNTQNVIENNEKQLMVVEKYELLLELNIKLQSFELKSKNNPLLGQTNFNNNDYNNYLTLIYIQYILIRNKEVFMLLFPKTLLYYTQFKFTFTQNLSSVLPENKSHRILIELFKEIFETIKEELYFPMNLNYIEYPEMIGMAFPSLEWINSIYKNSKENLEDYQKGVKLYFEYLNQLIELFNKEFEEQMIKYDLY